MDGANSKYLRAEFKELSSTRNARGVRMHNYALNLLIALSVGSPGLAIAVLLMAYHLRRLLWRRNKRLGRKLGYYPSSAMLGLGLLFLQVFYRPSVVNVLEEKQKEDAEEEGEGDSENLKKQLDRQLKKIRRGEPIESLVLRL
jgi:hypothetical protein